MYRSLVLGLITASLASNAVLAQQNPNGVIPVHTSNQPYLFLVRDPVVHEAAKLTDAQRKQLAELNGRLDLQLWSMRNKGAEHISKTMNNVLAETKTAMSKFLKTGQVQRIQQVELWVLGVKSLLRDDVASHLDLDKDSQEQIRQIIVQAQQKMGELQKELQAGGDAAELNEKWAETKHQQRKDAIAILSDEQQQKFRAMLGEQVELAKLGRIKMKVPDFVEDSKWVNSEPLTLDKLKGKVVALHFYAFA